MDFVKDVAPTRREWSRWKRAIATIQVISHEVLGPKAKVRPFGSFASGLSTFNSDLDLVICDVIKVTSAGYTPSQKARAVQALYRLAKRLVDRNDFVIETLQVIPRAKVPILKVTTQEGFNLDLSVHNHAGPLAAEYVRQQLREFPAARPVCLVIKTLLKELGLNDVSTGGLGGYALANMAICRSLDDRGTPMEEDYGKALLSFLEYYGTRFDYIRQGVSLRRSGVLPKKTIEEEARKWIYNPAWEGRTDRKKKLLVEDPLTGLNISGASTRYGEVKMNLSKAYRALKAEVDKGGNINSLNVLFDVERVTQRPKVPYRPEPRYQHRRRRVRTANMMVTLKASCGARSCAVMLRL